LFAGGSSIMSGYSIPDLLRLLRSERGECVRLDVGSPPTLVVKGESHQIEGPAVVEQSVEEMLRSIASSREMRVFRETGSLDIIVPLEGARFLVRAVRAFSEFRLELQPISL
jgi:Tfp pilus assembly pilus retraction ATPase PilT